MDNPQDYEIDDVNSFVVDSLYIKNENEQAQGLTQKPYCLVLSIIDKDFDFLVTVAESFTMNGEPDREDADLLLGTLGYHTAHSLILNSPETIGNGFAFLCLVYGEDMEHAEKFAEYFQIGIEAVTLFPTYGVVATDGTNWVDLHTERRGTIPLGFTSLFEEYNAFSGKKSFTSEEFELIDIFHPEEPEEENPTNEID